MSTKTIYVSNDAQTTFDRAQELAGENLSAVIVRALSEFIARKEAMGKGMKEISVQVGTKGLQSEKRFIGRVIAKWKGVDETNGEWLEAIVYKTKKDYLALSLEHRGNPEMWTSDGWHKPEFWQYMANGTKLTICKNLDEIRDKMPAALISVIEQAIARDETPVEYLDI